jgi:hypothetical protein
VRSSLDDLSSLPILFFRGGAVAGGRRGCEARGGSTGLSTARGARKTTRRGPRTHQATAAARGGSGTAGRGTAQAARRYHRSGSGWRVATRRRALHSYASTDSDPPALRESCTVGSAKAFRSWWRCLGLACSRTGQGHGGSGRWSRPFTSCV